LRIVGWWRTNASYNCINPPDAVQNRCVVTVAKRSTGARIGGWRVTADKPHRDLPRFCGRGNAPLRNNLLNLNPCYLAH
jgi:hypothetical protein